MWGWIKSAASSVSDFVSEHKSAIASTLAALAVGLAVGALVVFTGGAALVALGPVASAMIVGGAAGAASSAASYATKQWMDDKPVDGLVLLQQGLLGLGLGILTAGVGARALPFLQRTVTTPLVESLAPEATTLAMKNKVSAVVANGLIDGVNALPEKIVQNAANERPWDEGVVTAPLLGAATGVAKTLLRQGAHEGWAWAKGDVVPTSLPMKPRFTPAEDAATGQRLQGIALGGTAAAGAAHVAGKMLELPTPPRPRRPDLTGGFGETAPESSATPALASVPATSAPAPTSAPATAASPAPEPPRQGFVQALDEEGAGTPGSPQPATPATPSEPTAKPASAPSTAAPSTSEAPSSPKSAAARELENAPFGGDATPARKEQP